MRWKLVIPLVMVPSVAHAGAVTDTFGPGGVGFALVQLLLIASATSIFSIIASALGKGQIAKLMMLIGTFGCIGIVLTVVLKTIYQVAKAFGVTL